MCVSNLETATALPFALLPASDHCPAPCLHQQPNTHLVDENLLVARNVDDTNAYQFSRGGFRSSFSFATAGATLSAAPTLAPPRSSLSAHLPPRNPRATALFQTSRVRFITLASFVRVPSNLQECRYVDLRKGWWLGILAPAARVELARGIAAIAGLPLRDLVNWEKKRQLRLWVGTTALWLVLIAGALVFPLRYTQDHAFDG